MKANLYNVLSRMVGEDYSTVLSTFKKEEALEKAIEKVNMFIDESHDSDLFNKEEAINDLKKINTTYIDNLCEIIIEEIEVELPMVIGIKYEVDNNGWGIMDETFLTAEEAKKFLKEFVEKTWSREIGIYDICDEIEESGAWYIEDLCYYDIIQVI